MCMAVSVSILLKTTLKVNISNKEVFLIDGKIN